MRFLWMTMLCLPLMACAAGMKRQGPMEADIAFQPLMHAPCPDYLRARRIVKDDREFAYLFSGYFSAANHMVSISVPEWTLKNRFPGKVVDITGKLGTQGQMEWVDRYCGLHPEHTVQQGLYAITNEMLANHKLERYFYHIAR